MIFHPLMAIIGCPGEAIKPADLSVRNSREPGSAPASAAYPGE
jgi:hypothetical protein